MSAPLPDPTQLPPRERLQLPVPRPLLWLLGTLLLVAVAGLMATNLRTGKPGDTASMASRELLLMWRMQQTFAQPPEAPQRPDSSQRTAGKPAGLAPEVATPAPEAPSPLVQLMRDATATGAEPELLAVLPAVAVAAREDAAAASLVTKLPTLSADLRAALAALPDTATATAVARDGTAPMPLTEARQHVASPQFGKDYSPYLRERLRHRLLVRADDRDAASALAERLHEDDRLVAAVGFTLLQVVLLAALYGAFWWMTALLRTAASRAQAGGATSWIRAGLRLPATPGYPVDPLVPFLGLALWLGGHAMGSAVVGAALGPAAGGFAMLLSTGIGLVLAQLLIARLSSRIQPLQVAALLGGKESGLPTPAASVVALRGFAALLPAMAVTVIVGSLLLGDDAAHPAASQLLERPDALQALTIGLSACLLAPLAEELLFRGLILRALVPLVGAPRALLVSAVLFALVHLAPASLPAYTLLGAAFGAVYLWTGNLWASVILHALWNTVTMVVMLLLAWS